MDTSLFKLNQIGIVMLGVGNLDRSIEFYRDQLGLALKYQIPGFAFLDAGGVTLCLSEPLAKASSQTVGATEIVFSVEHVRAAHTALQNNRISFVNEPRNVTGSSWAANFMDLDGHRLSIFGPE